jgi:serine protease Do
MNIKYLVIFLGVILISSCTPKSKSALIAEEALKESNQNQPDRNHPSTYPTVNNKTESIPSEASSINGGNSLSALFNRSKSAVFMIFTSDGNQSYQGSGFFVSSNGIAVSNYHVFEGTTIGREVIKLEDGTKCNIERIINRNIENDFIIFKVSSDRSFQYLRVCKQLPSIGEGVFAIGNPRGLEQTLSTGIVSGYRENNKLIQTTAEITHGSSGGPLLNMNGEVIGITTSGMDVANLNFAMNIRVLQLHQYLK